MGLFSSSASSDARDERVGAGDFSTANRSGLVINSSFGLAELLTVGLIGLAGFLIWRWWRRK